MVHPVGSSTMSTGLPFRHMACLQQANVRDNTFVTVTTRHLVTRLDSTFNRKINL